MYSDYKTLKKMLDEIGIDLSQKDGRTRIDMRFAFKLDYLRYCGKPFTINGIEFIPNQDEFGNWNYITLKNGEKTIRIDNGVVYELVNGWLDPETSKV